MLHQLRTFEGICASTVVLSLAFPGDLPPFGVVYWGCASSVEALAFLVATFVPDRLD
jgi:hypothetical protein